MTEEHGWQGVLLIATLAAFFFLGSVVSCERHRINVCAESQFQGSICVPKPIGGK